LAGRASFCGLIPNYILNLIEMWNKRNIKILVMVLLCLAFRTQAQSGVLDRQVSLRYDNVSLEAVLKSLSKEYGLKFSYVNNLIPLQKKVSIQVKKQSLKYVLDELLRGTEVNYQLVGEQIVLKYEPKAQSALEVPEPTEASRERPMEFDPIRNRSQSAPVLPTLTTVSIPVKEQAPYQATVAEQRRFMWVNRYVLKLQEFFETVTSGKIASSDSLSKQVLALNEAAPLADSTLADSLLSDPYWDYAEKDWQLTIVTPLGTNGTASLNTVNRISVNIIAGAAAGLEGVEFGGLLNMETDYAHGVQAAGFANLVRNEVTGAQFAGFANVNGGKTTGVQGAGFANVVVGHAQVTQAAGFANVVTGHNNGSQFAGFANVTHGNVGGPQAAGFINVAVGDSRSAQVAGFMNVAAGKATGAQIAGFANVAKDVEGVQISGFLNHARRVKGTQIGILNVADSVSGASIGLLSFVKHGYRRFEIGGSEALYGNVIFKTGTRHFYNILAVGVQPKGGNYRWAVGYGIGTEQRLSPGLSLSIDALSYHVNENEAWTRDVNSLNQLKLLLGVRLAGQTYLFAGPTFNVLVSRYYNAEKGQYGSDLAPWRSYNQTNGTGRPTNVQMWVGLNAGIRF
jgi:hypothetical protein